MANEKFEPVVDTRIYFFSITSKLTRARPENPSLPAAAGVRTMTRPRVNGPRSLMRTITVWPLPRLVTRTRVQKGSVRCAAVNSAGLARSPLAVWPPR